MNQIKKRRRQKARAEKTSSEMLKLQSVISRACLNFKAPENISVSQWADKYRRLSSENSAEAGQGGYKGLRTCVR